MIKNRNSFLQLLLCCLALSDLARGQATRTPVAVARGGYAAEAPEIVSAPGQLFTLSLYGLDYFNGVSEVSKGLPLPKSLNGLSVTIQQGNESFAAPILAISQRACPPSPQPCATLTQLSVQIPFELRVNDGSAEAAGLLSYIIVQENAVNRGSTALRLIKDNIHLANTCDSVLVASNGVTGNCRTVVVHGDGSYVTPQTPAKVGEYLTMYAFGLGKVIGELRSGDGTPSTTLYPPVGKFVVSARAGSNLNPERSNPGDESIASYVGLAPGFVGLYQVNFRVPALPAGTQACRPGVPSESNMTVTLSGEFSFAGTGICVLGDGA